jgi:Do/DeqQ family serine protease
MQFPRLTPRLRRPAGLAATFAAGLVVAGAGFHGFSSAPARAAGAIIAPVAVAPGTPVSYADVVGGAMPAVVTVRVERQADSSPVMSEGNPFEGNPFFERFFNQRDQQGRQPNLRRAPAPLQRGLGSGVIVSADGQILTNHHVVDGAEHVTVELSDGRELQAKVVGTDAPTDLAVLDIEAEDLPVLPLGDSDNARVGDVVLAVGNPFGVGQTVTMGIISAKGRQTPGGGDAYEDFIQTDAPINHGNSGGALITSTGQLIGINSQILSPSSGFMGSGGNVGIGFAIPSNMAKHVMSQLVSNGRVQRAMIGVTVQPVTSDLARSLGLAEVQGALVNGVEADGPAATAGVKQGDVILAVNDAAVSDANALRNLISTMTPGATVTLTIQREGQEQQISVELAELPGAEASNDRPARGGSSLGMTLQPVTPALARELGVPAGTQGLAVREMDPSGPAASAGLRQGDVIRSVNGEDVATVAALNAAREKAGDRPALTLVQRGERTFFVTLPAR